MFKLWRPSVLTTIKLYNVHSCKFISCLMTHTLSLSFAFAAPAPLASLRALWAACSRLAYSSSGC
jgi:hypothetical protein